ncbi:hypothetical protein ACFO0N_14105 [Halobium salinum]|uniref:Uncharacterized protein n=1 Tax=Halobium salinum TaxID=1364940 RepID=A0ABD5PDX0_9EURY|nr:hypothetical protein [Halobium salinum]
MAKVSIGLRGWRFEESEVFTEDGEFRPLEEIPEDTRNRLVRLAGIVEDPCDACYLIHGEEDIRQCNPAAIVYGEPGDELLLCTEHEADFLYWFREDDGDDLAGEELFRDSFHEWFAAGNRAPEGYAGLEHVDTDPDALPEPPDPAEVQRRLEEGLDLDRVTVTRAEPGEGELLDDDFDEEDAGLDLDTDYPTK